MNTIEKIIFCKNWDVLITKYTPSEICSTITFNQTMKLTNHLVYDEMQNDFHQSFGLKLVYEIKKHFKIEWDTDWKNEVFLGDIFSFLGMYDEQYVAYKTSHNKLKNPPATLLLLLAGCQHAPGIPPITQAEAESYTQEAAKKEITFETALMMRTLYERKGDISQIAYWDRLYKQLKEKNICCDPLTPDALI